MLRLTRIRKWYLSYFLLMLVAGLLSCSPIPLKQTPLKQTLDWPLPWVLGFLSGPHPEARFDDVPAPSVHMH